MPTVMRGTLTMSISDDDDADMTERPRSRRRRWAVGGVALLAVLGPAAYFVTAQLEDRRSASTGDLGVAAPVLPASSSTPSVGRSSSHTAAPSVPVPSSAVPSSASAPAQSEAASVDSKVRAAREAAAKAGHPLQRALTPRDIPNVLLCFRTSATRSVVTLAVGKTGSPSATTSTAVLAREWAKLG